MKKNEEKNDARVGHTQYDPLPLVARPLATASENQPESCPHCGYAWQPYYFWLHIQNCALWRGVQ